VKNVNWEPDRDFEGIRSIITEIFNLLEIEVLKRSAKARNELRKFKKLKDVLLKKITVALVNRSPIEFIMNTLLLDPFFDQLKFKNPNISITKTYTF